jgi:hypothetical protein
MERAGRLIHKLKLPGGAVSNEDLARAAWAVAVGPRIAAHTRAVALVRTRLVVEVEDAVWQRQLFTLRYQILHRFAEIAGAGIADQVEFRVMIPRRGPQREERVAPPQDEADEIRDPILRRLYRVSRQKGLA